MKPRQTLLGLILLWHGNTKPGQYMSNGTGSRLVTTRPNRISLKINSVIGCEYFK